MKEESYIQIKLFLKIFLVNAVQEQFYEDRYFFSIEMDFYFLGRVLEEELVYIYELLCLNYVYF